MKYRDNMPGTAVVKAAGFLLLSIGLTFLTVLGFSHSAAAQGLVEFCDDFEAGLDPAVWYLEIVNGAQWAHTTEGGNGYVYCPPQSPYNYNNRTTDLMTLRDDFSDFTMTWDMRYHTQSWDRDRRPVYFRADESPISPGNMYGYSVFIAVVLPEIPSPFLDLHKRNPDGSEEALTPAFVPYPWVQEQWYSFKLNANGTQFKLKVWPKGDPEPVTWTIEGMDAAESYSSGSIGFGNYWAAITDVDNVCLWKRFVQCPGDTVIPAFSTIPNLVLDGFSITNVDTIPLSFDYYVTSEGPATLVDNGDPASLAGTTPLLMPGESFSPPRAALDIPDIRIYTQELVTYHVSALRRQVEFSDDFEAGLDPAVWYREIVNGAQWAHTSEGGNGYVYCPPQSPYDHNNRMTDLMTLRDDFSDFTMMWDMRYHTQSWDRDRRRAHFRAYESPISPGNMYGYSAFTAVVLPEIPSPYLDLHKFNPDNSGESLTPAYVPYPWVQEQWYSFKLDAVGNQFKLKVWPKGGAGPAAWTIEGMDTAASYSSGSIGFGNYWAAVTDVDNVYLLAGDGPAIEDSCTSVITFDPPVPVFITSFDAEATDTGVRLSWNIYSDKGINGFRIYRSTEKKETTELLNTQLIESDVRIYVDDDVRGGEMYEYTLTVVLDDGTEIRSQTVALTINSYSLMLYQNYPNPFNPVTSIDFVLDRESQVQLLVYDTSGRLVRTLVNCAITAGAHSVEWDGRDHKGTAVASGVYFYQLKVGDRKLTRKAVLLK